MLEKKTAWALVAGAISLSGLGVAAARTGGLSSLPLTRALLGAPPTADVRAGREVNVPLEQQVRVVDEATARMNQNSATVKAQLEQARAARDVVKVLCLNDKLNQISLAIRTAKDRSLAHHNAVVDKDVDRARHEFTVHQVLKDRVEQLTKEANQCIGEETGFIGESQVSMNVDPGIPDNNIDQLGSDPEIISEPPVLSSPVK